MTPKLAEIRVMPLGRWFYRGETALLFVPADVVGLHLGTRRACLGEQAKSFTAA